MLGLAVFAFILVGIFAGLISLVIGLIVTGIILDSSSDSMEVMFKICLCIGVGAGTAAFIDGYMAQPHSETYEIYSIEDNMGLKGSFVLGSGIIQSNPQYVYYQVENSGYRLKTVGADKTIVFMDNETPNIQCNYDDMNVLVSAEIHVPENTIIKQYSLGGNV